VRGADIETDVLIVGGGLAGLTAAVGLADAGLKCVVVEATDRLGGRAQSTIDEKTGDPVHIGPHILLSEYPNMLRLLDRLGTRKQLVWQTDRFVRIVDGRYAVDMKHSALPAPLHYAPSLARDRSLRRRDVLSNIPVSIFAAQLDEQDVLRLDNVNASAFLRSMGVTEHFIQRFWAFASMAIMNVPIELCSAGALLRFYRQLIGHKSYHVGFPSGGLGDLFAPGAKAYLERSGSSVLLGHKVVSLSGDRRRIGGAVLADGRRVGAGHTIAALPPQALAELVGRERRLEHRVFAELSRFQPCPYVSTYLWFDRKLTDQRFWARAHRPDDLNCDFYDLSNINRGWEKRSSLIATNAIFSHRAEGASDEEIVRRTQQELAEYLPEAARAKILHQRVHRIPMAIHCPFPGTEQLRPPVRSPIDRLLLAGDWIATGLPSSMESACMAGWQAVEAVLADVGRPQQLAIAQKEVEGLVRFAYRAGRAIGLRRLPRWVRPTGPDFDWRKNRGTAA
jgi:squalene-associated FAD-dependent desaturase